MSYVTEYRNTVRGLVMDDYLALCRIPSISADPEHHDDVRSAARLLTKLLDELKLFDVVVEYDYREPRGPSTVIARRAAAPGHPVIGLYAHFDVQPADAADWRIPDPFQPVLEGDRLIGRGTTDDKAGIFAILAALRLASAEVVRTGCGLVVLLEGEEEVGSPRLERLVEDLGELVDADEYLVLDAANVDQDTPALTTSIRGNLTMRVGVKTLRRRVHSGGSGGVLPDAVMVASRVIAGMYDDDGAYALSSPPAMPTRDPVPPALAEHVLSPLHGATRPIGNSDHVAASWHGYSATVTGVDVGSIAQASNTLLDQLEFLLSIRVPPGATTEQALSDVTAYLTADRWQGAEISFTVLSAAEPYAADASSPGMRRLSESVRRGWGVSPVAIGIGGSIPVVSVLDAALPGCEVLPFGVGGTFSRAHSTDENVPVELLDRIALTLTDYLLTRCSDSEASTGTTTE